MIKGVFVLLLAVSLISAVTSHAPDTPTRTTPCAEQPGVISSYALVTPVIDGVLSPGEWTDADTRSFSFISHTSIYPGTLWVKNDDQYLYLAVRVSSVDFNLGDDMSFEFDNDNDGI